MIRYMCPEVTTLRTSVRAMLTRVRLLARVGSLVHRQRIGYRTCITTALEIARIRLLASVSSLVLR